MIDTVVPLLKRHLEYSLNAYLFRKQESHRGISTDVGKLLHYTESMNNRMQSTNIPHKIGQICSPGIFLVVLIG